MSLFFRFYTERERKLDEADWKERKRPTEGEAGRKNRRRNFSRGKTSLGRSMTLDALTARSYRHTSTPRREEWPCEKEGCRSQQEVSKECVKLPDHRQRMDEVQEQCLQ